MDQGLEIGLHWAAVACYALSSCFFIYGFVFQKDWGTKLGIMLAGLGLLPHTLALLLRWYSTGHGPYLRRYEVFSSDVWIGITMFMVAQWRKAELKQLGVLVMPVSFLLIGMSVMASPQIRPLPETFQTFWLVLHIFFAKLAYGSCLIGVVLAVVYLVSQKRKNILAGRFAWVSEPAAIDELSYKFNGFGFIMISVMIIAGAIWANNAWGSYWSWDPVETWSLVSWVIYGIYLHLRRMHGWKGKKSAWLNIISFCLLLFTIFGIGVFYATGHSPYMV